jgi:hypothetical protein
MAFKIFVNKNEIEVYDTCEKMMLSNYESYLKTQDKLYFTNYHKQKKAKKPNPKELEDYFYTFFGDMLKITQNPRVLDRFENIHQILKLKTKYNSVMTILKCIKDFNIQLDRSILLKHIENLSKWNYHIDINLDLFHQLEKIHNRVKGLLTEIEILEKKTQDKDIEETINLNKEIIKVSTFLELRFQIDKEKTSVADWLEYCEMAKEKSINIEKSNKK